MNTWWLWILAALVCGIVEVMSVSFVFLSSRLELLPPVSRERVARV